jgi:fucose permease
VAVILALLLFFQFGNEWSVAGWLPLLLTKRVGVSPASSLVMLALYWLALLIGRVAVLAILGRVGHGKLLGGSVLAALFGCAILAATDNRFGAVTGILLVGAGFASVYPLAAERIRGRFPSYHPGFFNGIFSFAVSGGLLAPWSLGFFVELWGVGAVIAVPLLGTMMVAFLLMVLWAEAKMAAYG